MALRSRSAWRQGFLAAGVFLVCLTAASPHLARADEGAPLARGEQAYAQGRYEAAAALASRHRSPATAVLAAKALLTKALLLNEDDPQTYALAMRALAFADAARARNPRLVEAHLDAAIAYGLQANHLSTVDAIDKVNEARAAIDTALALAPNDPTVLATDGAWHLMLTGRLGRIAADLLFSASREHGLEAFQRAFALSPNDPKMLYHYAKVRMMQGDADALTEARAALNRLINMPADNVLVASLQALAPQLRVQIDGQEAAARPS